MTTKHTTVILPSKEIEDLKEKVRQLTSQRDQFQKEAIAAEIKIQKMKLMMEGIQMTNWGALNNFPNDDPNKMPE